MQKWVIGVDEAGRGPLAGPVSVGVALVATDFDWSLIPGVGDSKQVSEKKREIIYLRAKELQKNGQLDFAVELVSAKVIDAKGIVPAITTAMNKALEKLQSSPRRGLGKLPRPRLGGTEVGNFQNEVLVKLDGGLKAPKEYVHQETIIKGDAKEKVIGLASIMAKVTRDHYMERVAKKADFVAYDFARHKGYGTKAHREAIARHGLSPEHRATYCKNVK